MTPSAFGIDDYFIFKRKRYFLHKPLGLKAFVPVAGQAILNIMFGGRPRLMVVLGMYWLGR